MYNKIASRLGHFDFASRFSPPNSSLLFRVLRKELLERRLRGGRISARIHIPRGVHSQRLSDFYIPRCIVPVSFVLNPALESQNRSICSVLEELAGRAESE